MQNQPMYPHAPIADESTQMTPTMQYASSPASGAVPNIQYAGAPPTNGAPTMQYSTSSQIAPQVGSTPVGMSQQPMSPMQNTMATSGMNPTPQGMTPQGIAPQGMAPQGRAPKETLADSPLSLNQKNFENEPGWRGHLLRWKCIYISIMSVVTVGWLANTVMSFVLFGMGKADEGEIKALNIADEGKCVASQGLFPNGTPIHSDYQAFCTFRAEYTLPDPEKDRSSKTHPAGMDCHCPALIAYSNERINEVKNYMIEFQPNTFTERSRDEANINHERAKTHYEVDLHGSCLSFKTCKRFGWDADIPDIQDCSYELEGHPPIGGACRGEGCAVRMGNSFDCTTGPEGLYGEHIDVMLKWIEDHILAFLIVGCISGPITLICAYLLVRLCRLQPKAAM